MFLDRITVIMFLVAFVFACLWACSKDENPESGQIEQQHSALAESYQAALADIAP